ncbi:MAG: LLM class flavin-dependent oxidoreductase [SAR202 cluster bacterium]|nr:LLM class flavin-dependent oxidoreductase [SAR202 cluster bacterium]
MKFGLNVPQCGAYGDVRVLVERARWAEDAGWDGFFIWDHLYLDPAIQPMVDPWVALAAIALATNRVRIGTLVTPVARRRPWKLARETVAVDHLSGGRLILGVGLGDPAQWEFEAFGEEGEPKVRAEKLDEGLDVLTGLWTGKLFSFAGKHYQVRDVAFTPTPVQKPRIPVWVACTVGKPRPLRRAARWDGAFPQSGGDMDAPPLTPAQMRDLLAFITANRTSSGPYDLVMGGRTLAKDRRQDAAFVSSYEQTGVTWWMEELNPWVYGWEAGRAFPSRQMDERIRSGPPKP